MAELVFCYMAASNIKEAERISNALIENRLAACVNILGSIESCYMWQGKKRKAGEVALIAKTRKSLLPKLVAMMKEIHSYENPCIIAFPIVGGNEDFLKWVEKETES